MLILHPNICKEIFPCFTYYAIEGECPVMYLKVKVSIAMIRCHQQN